MRGIKAMQDIADGFFYDPAFRAMSIDEKVKLVHACGYPLDGYEGDTLEDIIGAAQEEWEDWESNEEEVEEDRTEYYKDFYAMTERAQQFVTSIDRSLSDFPEDREKYLNYWNIESDSELYINQSDFEAAKAFYQKYRS